MKNIVSTLGVLSALALTTACGGFTGLPGDKQLAEVTKEEAVQICETTKQFSESSLTEEERKTFACNIAGTVAGATAAAMEGDYTEACTEAKDTCMDAEAEEPEETSCEDASEAQYEGCEATIEQYEACQREQVENIKKSNAEFTCDEPAEGEDEGEDDGEKTACEIFNEACGTGA